MSRYLPPPLMALITGALMWLVSRYPETLSEPVPGQLWLAILIAAGGLTIMLLAAWQFRRAGTTVNPMRAEDSSEWFPAESIASRAIPCTWGMYSC